MAEKFTNVTDDRQTDRRQQIANVNASSGSLKITFKLHEIFRTCYLWPWLDFPNGDAIHYVLSSFVDDAVFSHNGANVGAGHWRIIHRDSLGGADGEVCSRRLPC